MSDDAHLAEYEALRAEILSRTQIGNGLMTLEIAALGAGLSSFAAMPEVLVGLAAVSSVLWLLWIDQAGQVWKLALYIAERLAPELQKRAPAALGWERFMREFDKGGNAGSAITSNINVYMTLVFGGVPPLLLIGFVIYSDSWFGGKGAFRVLALLVATGLWLFACRAYGQFRRAIRVVDERIISGKLGIPE
jgi:hypothetical protein